MAAYPRKQTVVIFLLCAFAVGGAATYVFGQDSGAQTVAESLSTTNDAQQAGQPVLPTDTDWQKQFLTASGASSTLAASGKPKTDIQKLTPVDVLGQNFLAEYMSLKQSGLTSDPAAVASAVDQIISQGAAAVTAPKTYAAKDIIATADTAATRLTYTGIIDDIYRSYSSQPDEADIAAQAFENSDMSDLSRLDPIITTYQKMIGRLVSTPVPQPLIGYHLDLLNGFNYLLYSTIAFRNADKDSLTALSAARIDAIGTQNIGTALSEIKASLATMGMTVNF